MIAPGDLVIVVRSTHACADRFLGIISEVASIYPNVVLFDCGRCRQLILTAAEPGVLLENKMSFPLSWLKKIDPPAAQQSVEEEAMA